MVRILVVSPHRDDAAFSCAISIRALRAVGQIWFANYFTVSEYAPFRRDEPGTITELRAREDQSFAQLAGICFEDLNLLDAPERLSLGLPEICAVRPLDEEDAAIGSIEKHIAASVPDLLLVPLALGNHIDHRVAQAAALASGVAGIAFYEDLPYAARLPDSAPAQRASELCSGIESRIISAADGADWKQRCAGVYRSQVSLETVQDIADYSARFRGGERLWLTPAAARLFSTLVPLL